MQYRKKPVVIEAIQYDGNNFDELSKFANGAIDQQDGFVTVTTLEGMMQARVTDYIIKGVAGEFYPCKAAIFEQTYELVENN